MTDNEAMVVRLALATFEDVLANELAFKDDGIPLTDRYMTDIARIRALLAPNPRAELTHPRYPSYTHGRLSGGLFLGGVAQRLLSLESDRACWPLVNHCEVAKKCSPYQREMLLTPGLQINASEFPVHSPVQRRHLNVRKECIYFFQPPAPAILRRSTIGSASFLARSVSIQHSPAPESTRAHLPEWWASQSAW